MEDADQRVAASLSMGEVMTHSAKALELHGDHPKAKKMAKAIQDALETKCTQIMVSATQSKEEIEKILTEPRAKAGRMNDKWIEELSRQFLPKVVLNQSSNIFHAVKDAFNSGCGYEYRNTRECKFSNAVPNWRPSLLGWMPSRAGWRPLLWLDPIANRLEAIAIGWMPSRVGWTPSL